MAIAAKELQSDSALEFCASHWALSSGSLSESMLEPLQLPIRTPERGPLAWGQRGFPLLLVPRQATLAHHARVESSSASSWSVSFFKRLFDVTAAVLVLVLLAIPMLAICICIRLSSRGPALFVQNRVGRGGQLFRIYKFRSMVVGAGAGHGLTADGDRRVTAFGRWMRKLKIDELPQLFNIMRGDMSLVGPRPKLPQYAGIANMPYRPGVTGAATIAFRHEEELLMHIPPSQLNSFYAQNIKPLKASIDTRYMNQATFSTDLRILAATLLKYPA